MTNLIGKINAVRKRSLGHNQVAILNWLEKTGKVRFCDFCKAQSRYNSYQVSWFQLQSDIEKAGVSIQIVPGKLGGTWTEQIVLN